MGTFTVGDVVLVDFPYSDFSSFKKRPALVVAKAEFDNLILCQITSNAKISKRSVLLEQSDFRTGTLSIDSFIRPDKIFTLDKSIIDRGIGSIKLTKTNQVKSSIRKIFI